MSSETIVTAIFLITAVVAAGILTSQIFPAIYTMSGSVSSSAQKADTALRTNIAIINTFASGDRAQVWVKNVGSSRIHLADLNMSTMFIGSPGGFEAVSLNDTLPAPPPGSWSYEILDNTNSYWDPMETLHVTARSDDIPGSKQVVYFQIVLYDGTRRSEEFTVS
ncbi:MAG: flagellin [Methanomicrobiales archaeon]|nr:flagellin [Methanomicrobiales archaeon]MDD1669890.1 flagellin [Methanomicrobiales archaeon]